MENTSLINVFDKINFDIVQKRIMKGRKVIDENNISYDIIEHTYNDKKYKIKAEHVPIDYLFKYANSSCKRCGYGKGYYVVHVEKQKIPNPEDYVVLSNVPIKDMPEEQQRLWIEKEKKNKFWRVMLPCKCALQRAMKKEQDILSTPEGNIIVRVSYEIEE